MKLFIFIINWCCALDVLVIVPCALFLNDFMALFQMPGLNIFPDVSAPVLGPSNRSQTQTNYWDQMLFNTEGIWHQTVFLTKFMKVC